GGSGCVQRDFRRYRKTDSFSPCEESRSPLGIIALIRKVKCKLALANAALRKRNAVLGSSPARKNGRSHTITAVFFSAFAPIFRRRDSASRAVGRLSLNSTTTMLRARSD